MSEEAQLFYRTLMLAVDDYGRLEVDVDVIRAICFPRQLDRWPAARIEHCLAAAADALTDDGAPLIVRYRVGAKEYLQYNNFGQRIQSKPKCPPPGGEPFVNGHAPFDPDEPPLKTPPQAAKDEAPAEAPAKKPPAKAGAAKTGPAASLIPAWFDEFWEMFWRKDGKERARQSFRDKVKTPEDWARVKRAVEAQTPEMLGRIKEHRPQASTWLNDARYADEESPPQIRGPARDDKNQTRRENVNKFVKALQKKVN